MSDAPELSKVERRRMDARRRILDAAQQLFLVESSYDKATISDIARCADVSVGVVYLLFKDKYAIVFLRGIGGILSLALRFPRTQ